MKRTDEDLPDSKRSTTKVDAEFVVGSGKAERWRVVSESDFRKNETIIRGGTAVGVPHGVSCFLKHADVAEIEGAEALYA